MIAKTQKDEKLELCKGLILYFQNQRVNILYTAKWRKGIIMNLRNLVREKRAVILDTAKRHGAQNVRIFGSVARGDFDEKRDLDFLVEMEPGRSLLDHASLLLDLEKLLGCKVDIGTAVMRDNSERILMCLSMNTLGLISKRSGRLLSGICRN